MSIANTTPEKSLNEKISFTADGIAYVRTFTDIPFSKEIFEAMERLTGPLDPAQKARLMSYPPILPYFESRYKMTDQVIRENGFEQILELAGGLSPRGIIMLRDDHDRSACYVELDLPDKADLKAKVLEAIHEPPTLVFPSVILEKGNVADETDFERACRHFDGRSVAVICEGLLRYMSWPDKHALASNVARLLQRSGGVWVTPDIELLDQVNSSPVVSKRYDEWAKIMGADIRPFLFKDLDHAFVFFEDHGFKVECRNHLDIVDKLVSPARLGLDPDTVKEELSKRSTFVLTPRK